MEEYWNIIVDLSKLWQLTGTSGTLWRQCDAGGWICQESNYFRWDKEWGRQKKGGGGRRRIWKAWVQKQCSAKQTMKEFVVKGAMNFCNNICSVKMFKVTVTVLGAILSDSLRKLGCFWSLTAVNKRMWIKSTSMHFILFSGVFPDFIT